MFGPALLAAAVSLAADDAACHPRADAGGPYAVECAGTRTSIDLDGTRSGGGCRPGDPIAYAWTTDCPGASFDDPASPTPRLTLASPPPCPVACSAELTVTDPFGAFDLDRAELIVADSTPPWVLPAATETCLWPPDGRWVCLGPDELGLTAGDTCGGPVELELACDPPDCRADGATVCVRARRAGQERAGRRHVVAARAFDPCGNVSPAVPVATVAVPHDRRDHPACR